MSILDELAAETAAYEAEIEATRAAIKRDTPPGYQLAMGVPYAHQNEDNSVTCPRCGQRIMQTERKDFESFTGFEYADHYDKQHALDDGCRLIHGRWYEPV